MVEEERMTRDSGGYQGNVNITHDIGQRVIHPQRDQVTITFQVHTNFYFLDQKVTQVSCA